MPSVSRSIPLTLAMAILLGLFTATHVCVFQYRMPPGLYAPWRIIQWSYWWGWAYTGPALQIGGLVTGLMCLSLVRKRPRTPVSARWATRRDLRRAGLFAPSGVVLGRYRGRIVRHNGPEHVLCVGPTGAGKGTSHVIPTLRDWPASVLVHDPKMELFALTRWHRGLFTRVVHFSPTESTSDCFNPLDAIRRDPEHMLRDTQLLAQMLVNPDGNEPLAGTTRHFHLLASELLAGLIVYGLETGMATTLGAVNRVLTLGRPWTELLKELEQCPQAAVQRAAHVAGDIVDRELSGLLSTTRNALQLWTDPLVDRATSRSDFQLSDLRDGIQPMTLYLSVPFSDQERLRPLSRLLVRQVIDASTQHLTGWRHRLLLLIDEVPALRHMPILAEGLDYLRGYGVKLDLVTQSLKPFEAYGARNNFWEGAHIRLIFPPNSGTLSRLMSAETGEQTITKTRRSYQESIFWRPGTISTEPTTEPLLTATELQQLKPDEILLLAGKQRVVLQQAKYY